VKEFKSQGSAGLAQVMAKAMASALVDHLAQLRTDRPHSVILVPAPSRPQANRERGYSPARMLATNLAAQLRSRGVSVSVQSLLSMGSDVKDQAGLSASERSQNLGGKMTATQLLTAAKPEQKLILIDDVVTTGATLLEMTRALKRIGLQPDRFLTFAEAL